MSLQSDLELCRDDPKTCASAAERILAAIGEAASVDTSRDPRLGRIFMNRTIRVYPAFAEFYGMEETIERIVSFFRHAAQGLEERKQILYLLGPVGGGKSSLAERLEALMEENPIYVLKAGGELGPVFESPLCLFDPQEARRTLEQKYSIPRRRLGAIMSPWRLKRLDEFDGDITRFAVAQLRPSRLRQIANASCAPNKLETLARFIALSRLSPHENSNLFSKLRVYDGECLREVDPRARSILYFSPRQQTRVMNEGCATYSRYRVTATPHAKGGISDGSFLEFLESHTNAIRQPATRPMAGSAPMRWVST